MKALVVNSDCIQVNSSANLCHIAYIKGLIECGYEVTLISADGRDYDLDEAMMIPDGVICHTYYGVTLYEKLSRIKRRKRNGEFHLQNKIIEKLPKGTRKLSRIKKIIYSFYGPHGIYSKFVTKAFRFRSNDYYDVVISLSTPASSHLLAYKLLAAGHIHSQSWIQIWEDPWYSDAYGFTKKRAIYKEEKRLLNLGKRICYVSPLTLVNQKKLFPESAEKMFWVPLPTYYEIEECKTEEVDTFLFGYFGDYIRPARDLEPFYKAAVATGIAVNICGNTNIKIEETEDIHVFPRMPLTELRPIEKRTGVLVFLCNHAGGQIPGKIYQYAATNKTILFILDGSESEKRTLREFFAPYNRFVFCNNEESDILRAISDILSGQLGTVKNQPLQQFEAKAIMKKILFEGMK